VLVGEDILFLYGAPWDAQARLSKHHIVEHLARRNRVLYIETPCSAASIVRHARERRKALRWLSGPHRVGGSLWVHTFLYPLPFHDICRCTASPTVNRLNQHVILPQLLGDLARLGMARPIVVVASATAVELVSRLARRLLVYHCSDKFAEFEGVPRCYAALERRLIAEADVVITTSQALLEDRRQLNANIFCVPNGADIEHFAQAWSPTLPVAEEVARLPRPVIGYVGTIASWFDQALVAYAARSRPSWQFVLIGPTYVEVADLRGLANVHLLGARPYEQVPRYIKGFDVAVCPFKINELTRNVSPIKFYEYLASGKPIVTTWMQELEQFRHLSAIVDSPQAFVAALEGALQERGREAAKRRLAEAGRHSWAVRTRQVEAIITEALRQGSKGPAQKGRAR